ncbi:hypothetical protein HGRIS_012617 [Hohenbuehelia grisea]|uniref:Chromatin modification-related protein n=1 Tax=Hohenbuehelia grisea TaxID=104357 RepID=A0ABR3ISV9_9AGAR
MSASVQSLEEAANIASEFIYSLDNLPNEVNHLLSEIKHRDTRNQELQREVDKDLLRYYRHQLRGVNGSGSNSNASSSVASPSAIAGTKGNGPNNSTIVLPAKITTAYAEMNRLADEKCELAKRLIELFTRTRSRLDVDLTKVRILQGEEPEPLPVVGKVAPGVASGKASRASAAAAGSSDFVTTGKNSVQEVTEALRAALATSASMSDIPAATPSASAAPAVKKRRLGATTSIKITARAPTPPTAAATASAPLPRSRLSRQIHPAPSKAPPPVDVDMDAEADDDADEDEEDDEDPDAEDESLYCFCQKRSYGDMIACDNEGKCPYEWFHLPCVGLKSPIPEKWYCSECLSKGAGVATVPAGRKGRKK